MVVVLAHCNTHIVIVDADRQHRDPSGVCFVPVPPADCVLDPDSDADDGAAIVAASRPPDAVVDLRGVVREGTEALVAAQGSSGGQPGPSQTALGAEHRATLRSWLRVPRTLYVLPCHPQQRVSLYGS